ncbi:MAG: DUF721 domain-containing protein [Chlamydiae bacterium]|nr:DUF721 domain-containing protein [Chlamydiota bacterium]MBI3276280.1 DUF721 domain-containing protein [Chlamydiota bacterium]
MKKPVLERKKREPTHVGKVIEDVILSLEQADLKNHGKIFFHWKEVVGDAIASHSRPYQVRSKKLKVFVDSSDWLYEITKRHEKEILEKIQSLVGKEVVKEIQYQIG